MSTYTVGIDIGTTGTKAILLKIGQGIVATATAPSSLHSDGPGWAEADCDQWVENARLVVRELMDASGVDPESVKAVSTTGMVPAVVLLDQDGKPLGRGLLQNDARAVTEINELSGELGAVDLVTETGSSLSQQSVAPTLRWFQKNRPDVWSKVSQVVGSYDWVLMALGARPHVERNWALESGLFFIDGRPHSAVLSAAGIGEQHVAPVGRAGDIVGELTSEHAEAMGLLPGTLLVVGGADHVLSAYSAGVSRDGDWLVKLGGAGDILVASQRLVVDNRLYLDAHPIDGIWLPNGCMATSGSLIRWFQALTRSDDLIAMDELASTRQPADVLCLPYFLGEKSPLHDPDLRGVFLGMHLGTTVADMYRAVLEAIAFGFRHHVDVLTEKGVALNRAIVTNGGSKSTLWKQIHADILGVPLHPIVNHPGASLGAAVIAGVGAGLIGGLEDVADYVTLGETVEPDPGNVSLYNEAYAQWRELSDVTTPLAHRLAERTRR